MNSPPDNQPLTGGQKTILAAATLPMVAFGALGAVGTYSNIAAAFDRSATALGVVAAGEGATLVLAVVMIGLTMLGQSSPAPVRIGLWTLPAVASGTGAIVATSVTEAVVYAMTPMAMCVSAEGLGLLARRIVVHRTGVDMEAQRRTASTVQRLAYHRARAANHPDEKARENAELKSWKLAKKVGVGDDQLGTHLVTVQRDRMAEGADSALAAMFTTSAVTPALVSGTSPVTPAVTGDGTRHKAVAGDTLTVTQATSESGVEPSRAAGGTGTAAVTGSVPETGTGGTSAPAVTLADVAAVAGVPVPVTGERLSDAQLDVVLRLLRYADDPPLSYRQAVADFREAGYVGSEERVRRAWGELMSHEETHTPTETERPHTGAEQGETE